MPASREAAFAAVFEARFDALLAYARRHTDQLAMPRMSSPRRSPWSGAAPTPCSPDASVQLAWLYNIARRVLSNQRRTMARRQRLLERPSYAFVPHRPSASAIDVAAALSTLRPADQTSWGSQPGRVSPTPRSACTRRHAERHSGPAPSRPPPVSHPDERIRRRPATGRPEFVLTFGLDETGTVGTAIWLAAAGRRDRPGAACLLGRRAHRASSSS